MVRSQALLGGLVVVLGLFVVGLTTYSTINREVSRDTRSQAAISNCGGQPESVCKATFGCKWIPGETTTTSYTCTTADCGNKNGCEWETVAGSKGVCSGGIHSRTGEDCMLIVTKSSCTGGCTWSYPSQKICIGSYTTSSTTAAKCEGKPTCLDPCNSHTDCGSGYYCDKPSNACATCKAQVCTPNQTTCSDGWLRVCNLAGSSITPQKKCDYGCNTAGTACNDPPPQALLCQSDSDCGPNQYCYQPALGSNECRTKTSTCTQGTLRCKDATYVERCSVSGTWIAEKCSAGCNQSTNRCNTICNPGTYRCEGQALQQCGSLGADWLPIQTCPQGTSCSATTVSCKQTTPTSTPTPTPTSTPTNSSLLPDKSPCSSSEQCQSNNCQLTPNGRLCLAAGQTVSTIVAAGGTCGTTAYNRECVAGYSCQQNTCKVIQAATPITPTPETKPSAGITALQTLNTITFGALGNYVASNVEQNQTYGYGTDNYDYWQRVANYENIRVATNLGATLVGEAAVGVYAGAAAGTMSIGTALAGGASTANFLFSTANTASVCQTPQDFLNNPMCQMASAQNVTAGLGFASLGTSATVKAISLVGNVADTALGGVNTFNYCKEYGINGTCVLFGTTTALGAVGTAYQGVATGKQIKNYMNQQIDDMLPSDISFGGVDSPAIGSLYSPYLPEELITKIDNLPKSSQGTTLLSKFDLSNLDLINQAKNPDSVKVYRGIWGSGDPLTNLQTPGLYRFDDLTPSQINSVYEYMDLVGTDVDKLAVWHKSGVSNSPFLGFSLDPKIASEWAGNTGRVIVAEIPASQLFDMEAPKILSGGSSQFVDEIEVGIMGQLLPEWITSVVPSVSFRP